MLEIRAKSSRKHIDTESAFWESCKHLLRDHLHVSDQHSGAYKTYKNL
jgi:hypothetical protein